MHIARRVYIYLVTFISLQLVLLGAASLLRLLGEVVLGLTPPVAAGADYRREQFSLWGAVLLVGAAVWGIHWALAQRGAAAGHADADQERGSVLRKLLLYAALFTALWQIFFTLGQLIERVLLDATRLGGQSLRVTLSETLPPLLVYGLGWAYYWHVRNADAAATPERGGAATVRRWYFYLANFGALSMTMWAVAELARAVWQLVTAGTDRELIGVPGVPQPIAGPTAWIVAGAAVWLWHWWQSQRLTAASEDEQHAVLRKVYLYGVILQTVAVTLTYLAFFFYRLLRLVLGTGTLGPSGDSLLTVAGGPLLTALVYGLFWAYHGQVLRWDAGLVAGEQPRQASIRRLYYYLVAVIGLAVLAGGVADLLRLLIDLVLGGGATTNLSGRAWGDHMSLLATLIVVGAPVWAFHWWRQQQRALAADGADERQSVLRRIYVYLVLFASVITLLGGMGVLIYRVLLTLGRSMSPAFISQVSWALGASVAAGVVLAYHLRVLIGDQRARGAAPAPEAQEEIPPAVVVLVRGRDAAAVQEALAGVRRDLPTGSQLDSFPAPGLLPTELGQWLASRRVPGAQPLPVVVELAEAQPAPA